MIASVAEMSLEPLRHLHQREREVAAAPALHRLIDPAPMIAMRMMTSLCWPWRA